MALGTCCALSGTDGKRVVRIAFLCCNKENQKQIVLERTLKYGNKEPQFLLSTAQAACVQQL